MSKPCVKLKRVYERAEPSDGLRILIDRLWPRGISKATAKIDLWLKEIAPSNELRKWFGHAPARWAEFQKRYRGELQSNLAMVVELQKIVRKEQAVTLLFAASDEKHNNAVALSRILCCSPESLQRNIFAADGMAR